MQKQIEQNKLTENEEYQMYIKGSGTSACLLTNKLDDQSQFIPLKIKNYTIFDIQFSGLYAVAIGKNDYQTNTQEKEMLQNKQINKTKQSETKTQLLKWGNLNEKLIHQPQTIKFQPNVNVKAINCGWNHTLFVTQNGLLFGMGQNKYGQLGNHNPLTFINQPISVLQKQADKRSIKAFAAGFRQSYWADEYNQIYGCGESKNYQLGISNKKQLLPQTKIQVDEPNNISNVVKFSCGKRFMLLLTDTGLVYGVGSNDYKCLSDGQVIKEFQKLIKIKNNIKDVKAGWNHIIFLDMQGRIWSKGRNNFGQLGRQQSQENSQVDIGQKCVEIETGTQFNFAVGESGRLYGWGWNEHMNIENEVQKQIITKPMIVTTPPGLHLQRCITYPAITVIKGRRTTNDK